MRCNMVDDAQPVALFHEAMCDERGRSLLSASDR